MNWHLYVAGAERVKWFWGLTKVFAVSFADYQ